jgi:hypothetical protein
MRGKKDATILEAAARDVRYEVDRLLQAADLYPKACQAQARRLLFEALLVHFRNLLDFFYGHPGKDLVHASHFFCDAAEWRPTRPTWLKEYRTRCNKLLAHLTYSRVEYARKGEMDWAVDEQMQHLRGRWNQFLEQLPPERRGWFQ